MRSNIFELLGSFNDISYEIKTIDDLLYDNDLGDGTVEEIIDENYISDWKARGNCVKCDDMRSRLGISRNIVRAKKLSESNCLNYLEYISNLIRLIIADYPRDCDDNYSMMIDNTMNVIDSLGFEPKVFDKDEIVILVQKDAAATSAAEISTPDIAKEIFTYNHYLLKGDLAKKQVILKILSDEFEGNREKLVAINSKLESNIGFMINNLNIRHNNKAGSKMHEFVKNLSDQELESYYDETYQMLLLSKLELDNEKRKPLIEKLKQEIKTSSPKK